MGRKNEILVLRNYMTMNYDNIMLKNLPKRIYNLLESIGEMGDQLGYKTFVVGGFVRDLILGRENLDIDIIAEGDGVDLAKQKPMNDSARRL
jgi:tRNA nucleotidyltransferase (CCA-adding enzyme)